MIAGEAQHLAHDVAGRVVAPVFGFVVHPGDAQGSDAFRHFRCDRTLEVDEFAAFSEFSRQARHGGFQRVGKRLELLRRCLDFLGPCPDRLDWRADRQRFAVAIDDASAMCGYLDVATVARTALLLQEAVVDSLQVERAPDEQHQDRKQAAEEQRRARARQLQSRRCGGSHRGVPSITSTRPAAGSSMRKCSRAIRSTRAGMAQVDCSI